MTKYVTLSLMEGLDLWLVHKGTICGLKGKFYISRGYGSQGITSPHGSVEGSPMFRNATEITTHNWALSFPMGGHFSWMEKSRLMTRKRCSPFLLLSISETLVLSHTHELILGDS